MVNVSGVFQYLLERVLSLVVIVSSDGTGSALQVGLLRMMGVRVEGPVFVGIGTTFVRSRQLRLGKYVCIGAKARFVGWDEIVIGNDFIASDGLTVNAGGHDPETLQIKTAPIHIGDRVWCGTNVTICAGVTIGNDVAIGAGSVVVRDLPDNCVAVGIPARPIRPLLRDPDQPLWSLWPERSSDGRYAQSGKLVQFLYRFRARI
jgi:acetyltransferase-like isoleucine patch superfamily enzyme